MPRSFDSCVRKLMADPDFKPRNPNQTKRSAAYAVCTEAYKKTHKGQPPPRGGESSEEEITAMGQMFEEVLAARFGISLDEMKKMMREVMGEHMEEMLDDMFELMMNEDEATYHGMTSKEKMNKMMGKVMGRRMKKGERS